MEDQFLGKPIKYWIELDKNIKEMSYEGLIKELVELRGKISFYESRIQEINNVMNK